MHMICQLPMVHLSIYIILFKILEKYLILFYNLIKHQISISCPVQ